MKSRKGKRIAVFCSMIVLLILIIIGLTAYFIRKRDKIEIENSQFPWEADTLFDATGKGNAAPEDSYLILDRETGILPHVFPGDSYVLVESKGRVTRFINEKDGETYVKAKPEYKYLDAVLYDLATGEEVRRIDLLEVIRDACPGFQYGYSDDLT